MHTNLSKYFRYIKIGFRLLEVEFYRSNIIVFQTFSILLNTFDLEISKWKFYFHTSIIVSYIFHAQIPYFREHGTTVDTRISLFEYCPVSDTSHFIRVY